MQIPVLVGILSTLLASDKPVRAEDLANKYEISSRSVYRYVAMLSEGGVPIESHFGRGGGWSIIETYKLKATYFSEEEYQRLLFAVQSFTLQDEVTKSITQRLQGLKRSHTGATVLKSNELIVESDDIAVGDKVSIISDCIAGHNLIEIDYHSRVGTDTLRTVEPYSLVMKLGVWYVYCYCRLRKDFRYFKVSRIVSLNILNEKFAPKNFVVDTSEIETGAIETSEKCEFILSVEGRALSNAEEWLGVGNVAKIGDGYMAKATLPYDDMLVSQILALGEGVRVEKPMKLRRAIAERCQRVAEINSEE